MSAPRRGARAVRRGTVTLATLSRQHEPDVSPMGSLRRTYRCGAVNRESYGEREASHDGTEGWSARAGVREALRR
jgi:hypothetical protein